LTRNDKLTGIINRNLVCNWSLFIVYKSQIVISEQESGVSHMGNLVITVRGLGLGLWCLTPLSTIFQ